MQNYGEIVVENAVKCISPDGFFCIQILPKINSGQGSAPGPAGGANNTPQTL